MAGSQRRVAWVLQAKGMFTLVGSICFCWCVASVLLLLLLRVGMLGVSMDTGQLITIHHCFLFSNRPPILFTHFGAVSRGGGGGVAGP